MKNVAKKLVTGSVMRFVNLLVSISLGFFMTPYLIHSLTDKWYGLWMVIASMLGFYGMLDLGISSATQRYIAKALPNKDYKELNSIVFTSLFLFSIVGLIALIITIILALLGNVFFSNPGEVYIFRWVVLISGTGVSINFLFWVLFGIITSNLRYDVISYLQIVKVILRAGLFILFLELGYGLIMIATVTVLLDLTQYIILYIYAKKLAPWLKFSNKYFQKSLLKKYFSFSKYSFFITLSDQLSNKTANLIIPIFLSLSHVAHYAIAVQISQYFKQASTSLLSVMVPVYTKYYSEGNFEKLSYEYLRVTRFAFILSCLGFGAIALYGKLFITLWLGEDYLDAYLPLLLLGFSIFMISTQIPSINVLFAINKHKYYAYMSIFEVCINVPLTFILLPKLGLTGAAIASTAPLVLTKLFIQPILTARLLRIKFWNYFVSNIFILCILLVCFILAFVINQKIIVPTSYLTMFVSAGILYSVILAIVYVLLLKKDDKELLMKVLKR